MTLFRQKIQTAENTRYLPGVFYISPPYSIPPTTYLAYYEKLVYYSLRNTEYCFLRATASGKGIIHRQQLHLLQ